jgi:multiple sugar transport system substrate-binding protein
MTFNLARFSARTLSTLAASMTILVTGCWLVWMSLPPAIKPFSGIKPGITHGIANGVTLKLACWGSLQELDQLRQLTQAFERQHPGTRVSLIHAPQQYAQKLHFMMASGQVPDVLMLNSWSLPIYARAKLLTPLALSVEQQQDLSPQAVNALSWQGQLWAYPRDLSVLAVYVNQSLLAQLKLPMPPPDWTLSDLATYRQPRYSQPLKQAKAWVISFAEQPPLFWLPWVWGFGGQLWDKTGTCLLPNNAATRQGLQAYADLRKPTSPTNTSTLAPLPTESGATPMAQWFVDQKLAFLVSGRWTLPMLKAKAHFNWTVMPLPAGPAGRHSGVDATGYAVADTSPNRKLAMALAAFLTNRHSLQQFSLSGLIVPARLSVAQHASYTQQHPVAAQVFLDGLKGGIPTQSHPQWNELSERLNEQLQPLWLQKENAQTVLTALHNSLQLSASDAKRCQ